MRGDSSIFVPLPSRVFCYSSGPLHNRISGRVFFSRGFILLIFLFSTHRKNNGKTVRRLVGLELQTPLDRNKLDLSYSVSADG